MFNWFVLCTGIALIFIGATVSALLLQIRNSLALITRIENEMLRRLEAIASHTIEIDQIKKHLEYGVTTTAPYDPNTDPANVLLNELKKKE